MLETSENTTCPPLISSAADSPVKMSASRARALALLESARASGVSLLASCPSFVLDGSLSKTSRMARSGGLMPSCETWNSKATRAYLSRSRQALSEHLTSENVFLSLLPTPSKSIYGTSNNGNPGDNRDKYATAGKLSLFTMARRGIRPNLTRGVAPGAKSPCETASSAHSADATHGGNPHPSFFEWMMGFPLNWTKLETERRETLSCPPVPKLSVGSSVSSKKHGRGVKHAATS